MFRNVSLLSNSSKMNRNSHKEYDAVIIGNRVSHTILAYF